ncbi:hypothetical protein WB401_34570 [Streptomyces brasiliscabiei]|uniref:Lipoprotein n=1 Tax=Streptomyces brasiliscabiei TaxID=2736302 RepID=A0ABU8GQ32_9ACTN
MINRHLRKAVVVTAALTTGLLMTACQNGSDTGSSSGGSGSDKAAVAEKASNAEGAKGAKGVSGSFDKGQVSYLAPGKYIVSVPGKDDQQFWVADDTEVYGAGTICGEAGSKVDAPCTPDQLEAATKKAAVNADVDLKDGIATLVTERRTTQQGSGSSGSTGSSGSGSDSGETAVDGIDKGKGVNGTWFGNVSYLAPGKYTVSDAEGTEQQFFTAEDTEIIGYDDICEAVNTGPGGEGGKECTEAELEAAAKKGFSAEVVISNGIATSIRDDN